MKNSIVKTPIIYKVLDLSNGQSAVIHMLTEGQIFVTLNFKEVEYQGYKTKISIDAKNTYFEQYPSLKDQLQKIENKITDLDGVYTCYDYLFTVKEKRLYLLSVALNETLGFTTVREIAKEIGAKTLSPNWKGIYMPEVTNVFLENIFIQKQ